MEMPEARVPRIIRMQQEWERRQAASSAKAPTKEGEDKPKRRSSGGVYCGPWPRWKYLLFRVARARCFLPPPFSRG